MTRDVEVLRSAVESAIRAPSGHNTQPWRFRLFDDRVELLADRTRRLPVVDPDDRALVMSCGAALAFLLVALRHAGYAGDVTLMPDPGCPDLLVSVRAGDHHTPTERDRRLFGAIGRRHTHRAAFAPRAVPDEVLTALAADGECPGATLHLVRDAETKRRVAGLVADGDRSQMADPRFRGELASWVRSNYSRRHDGMPGYAFGIPGPPSLVGPWVMRKFDLGTRQAAKDAELAASAPALLLVTTPGDTEQDWLAAGRAVGAALLTATGAGLAASFLNQPIETTELRTPLARLVDPAGRQRPQLLLRLGFAARSLRPTPRRPVEEILESPAG